MSYEERIFQAAIQLAAPNAGTSDEISSQYAVAMAIQIWSEVCKVCDIPLCSTGTAAADHLNARLSIHNPGGVSGISNGKAQA